ncbi:MAG: DUF2306 domain-containing protein [Gammaproteobacteria bacterium]|jgi:uncharacterized membrane protein|nr:DUF2306 domain-containing protein [Gammaproteobacteria bacterium]
MHASLGNPSHKAKLVWALFAVAATFYALLAMQSGIHNLPSNFDPRHLRMLDQVEAQANRGVPYAEVEDAAREAYPLWNNLMARVTGTYYGFGSNGTTDPTRYYASMRPAEKSVLSLHMVLGGVCLILGIWQFWPDFRARHRRLHRALGSAYVLSAYTMVGASVYHLLHTGVEHTYQGFTFYLQLWFLVISTAMAQTLAIYFIRKRNFALHLGCQAYTYAAFLSAPLQRYDWVMFGRLFPRLSQGEVNNLVNIMTFWQCLLVAYLIFVWNRAAAPAASRAVAVPAAPAWKAGLLWALALLGVASTVAFYVQAPGLANWPAARDIVPASTLAADAALFAGSTSLTLSFTVATCAAILSGMWLVLRGTGRGWTLTAFTCAAVVSGAIQMTWGWQLGEPNIKVIAGGGFYWVSGVSLILFALVTYWLEARGKVQVARETLVFAVNFAFAPCLLLWQHVQWQALDVIPPAYLALGHGYILAAGGAILVPTLNGFIAAFSSEATRARAIH